MKNNYNQEENYRIGRIGENHFHHKDHPWFFPILIAMLVVFSVGLLSVRSAYNKAHDTFQSTYQSGSTHNPRNVSHLIESNKPFSILLLGTDTGALGRTDKGRTDTMILASVNPDKNEIYLTSIPRDTKVHLPGDNQPTDKINNAYTIGGPSEAMSAVKDLLNVPVDYYAVVNMGGLEKMVNSVNGVTVDPPLSFKYGSCKVKKNHQQTLHGKAALDYARMRHQDPRGDFGRQLRQREILQKLIMKGLKISSLPRYRQILASLQGNLITDMKFNDMIAIRFHYAHATRHINSESINEKGQVDNGIDYEVPQKGAIQQVSQNIRKSLEMNY